VCTAEDFPSVLYLYEGLARHGVEIVRVPSAANHEMREEDIVAALDERVAVLAISHVLFRSSQILDLATLVERAHEVGALVLIDAYQAIGTVPVDVRALGVDLLAGGSVKWLCGGPGASFLYCSPKAAPKLRPKTTGWLGHEQPFAFDTGPMRWDAGARRFWTGTPSIPAIVAGRVGFETVAEIGVPKIRAKSMRQTERLVAWADEYGMTVGTPRDPARRGGSVVLDVPHAGEVCEKLLAADVLLDFRPGVGLRLGPHFYTRDDEVDLVMKRVRDEVAAAEKR